MKQLMNLSSLDWQSDGRSTAARATPDTSSDSDAATNRTATLKQMAFDIFWHKKQQQLGLKVIGNRPMHKNLKKKTIYKE